MLQPSVTAFFDPDTFTISYVISDPTTGHGAIIDSVLDYDAAAGRTVTDSADKIITHVREQDLTIDWIIDTHVHADHLTAAPYLKKQVGGKTAISRHIADVQKVFSEVFNEDQLFHTDGSQFDHLFEDDEVYAVGSFSARAIHTPGHTPACMSHLIGDALFVGDTIFMPDFGSARCDFPGGDASVLYDSIQRLFALPDETRMFLCHDYKAPGRDHYAWETTVGQQKRENIHLRNGISKAEFMTLRTARDATLTMPKLLVPSVQVNIRAGQMPPAENNGVSYLKVPINVF